MDLDLGSSVRAAASSRGSSKSLRIVASLASAFLLCAGAVPSHAATPPPVSTDGLDDKVSLLRAAIADDTLTGAVQRILQAGSYEVPPAAPATGAPRRRLPRSVAAAVAALEGAIEQASVTMRPLRAAIRQAPDASLTRPLDPARERTSILSGSQRARLHGAVLDLARAVDTALDLLGSGLPSTGVDVKGCDVLSSLPAVCIGGAGNNRYVAEAALQIDLGGNDTYKNAAGAADPAILGGKGNGFNASIAIDLNGDDLYNSSVSPAGSQVALGSGFYGGVGFLVDGGGDDRYRVRSGGRSSQGAAGLGLGVVGGGALADLGGDDSYVLDTTLYAEGGASSVGGGVSGEGFGLLLDSSGDDAYAARSSPAKGFTRGGSTSGTALAWGIAAAAPGVLLDGGGKDRFRTEVSGSPSVGELNAIAEAYGFAGLGGLGAVVTSGGDTRYELAAIAETSSAAAATTHGFGEGVLGGTGILSDLHGDDVYNNAAISSVSRWEVPRADVDQAFRNASSLAVGLGEGSDGFGFLQDLSGDDSYRLLSHSSASYDPAALDGVKLPLGPEVAPASASALGMGAGDLGGTGKLFDAAGDDRYSTRVFSMIPGGDGATQLVRALSQAFGQTGGTGTLFDASGTDRYSAQVRKKGKGEVSSLVHASTGDLGGSALLTDLGPQKDRFRSGSRKSACAGTYGGAYWQGCGSGVALGFNPDV